MNLSDIRPFIMVEAYGCPFTVVDSAALLSVRDFLRETRAWRQTFTSLTWAHPDLTISIPAGAEVSSTDKVYDRLRKKPLDFMTGEQLREYTDVAWMEPGPNPIAWTLENGNQPTVYPVPAATATTTERLDVTLVLNIAKDPATTALPDWLWEKYEEAFTFGTLARLLRIPGKDWTNPQQASAYGQAFQRLKVQAKTEAVADFGRPTRVVRYGGY